MDELKVFVISDSLGETGALVIRAVMSQFKSANYRIRRFPYIYEIEKLKEILLEASSRKNAIVIYTLVDMKLVEFVRNYSMQTGLLTIDLINPLMNIVSKVLEAKPSREPGIIRRLDETYFNRVAAIEFAVKYDDGKDPRGLLDADLVLIGVSRTSKTPLSMYLANKNIKVANIPLVVEVIPPEELFQINPVRIIGLTNSPEKLNEVRTQRLRSLGLHQGSNYANLDRILKELDYADKIMRRIGCPIIDVSDKAIEETSEIILNLSRRSGINFN